MAGQGNTGRHQQEQQFGVFEDPSENTFSRPGTVGLANSGNPDMFGSELFITLIPSPWLDGRYHSLGRVVRGMQVCDDIASRESNSGVSKETIEIDSCKCW